LIVTEKTIMLENISRLCYNKTGSAIAQLETRERGYPAAADAKWQKIK
jgi:hypothetical protein